MKKGFTLVELIIVLSLILMICSFSFISFKGFLETKNRIRTKEFLYEIEDTISYGRSYCINNNIPGRFVMIENKNNEELVFETGSGVIRKIQYDKVMEIDKTNKLYPLITTININSDGGITSTSIYLKDRNNEKYKISITPIVFLINIVKE